MKVTTNIHNGQTITLPFVVSDYNTHGTGMLIDDLIWFADTYFSGGGAVWSEAHELEGLHDDNCDPFEAILDTLAEIINTLEQFNLDRQFDFVEDNFTLTLIEITEE